jgi:hypothetical protein
MGYVAVVGGVVHCRGEQPVYKKHTAGLVDLVFDGVPVAGNLDDDVDLVRYGFSEFNLV